MGFIKWCKRKRELRAWTKGMDKYNKEEREKAFVNIANSLQAIEKGLFTLDIALRRIEAPLVLISEILKKS